MRLSQIYKLVLKYGIANDPRRDKSKIKNFADTAILYGRPNTEVKKILVGIDIEAGEIMLAEKLREKQGLDLVISHHPEGQAYAVFYEVMRLQIDLLDNFGVNRPVAQKMLEDRLREVQRKVLAANHMRAVDAARLLDLPFMCMHTPADNHVSSFIAGLLKNCQLKKVSVIIDILNKIPEYRIASKELHSGPQLLAGNLNRPAGKIYVDMTGGTEGPRDAYEKLYKSGVRTLVGMHLGEDHLKKAQEIGLNVVIAGHISSDNLGMNLLLDNIERSSGSEFEITACSGFRRIKRKK